MDARANWSLLISLKIMRLISDTHTLAHTHRGTEIVARVKCVWDFTLCWQDGCCSQSASATPPPVLLLPHSLAYTGRND